MLHVYQITACPVFNSSELSTELQNIFLKLHTVLYFQIYFDRERKLPILFQK